MQSTIDERMFYRVRKTTLEMLRDRGYELHGALDEDFDTFKQRLVEQKINMLLFRSCPNDGTTMAID